MIKLFRNTRRKLLSENKFSKYLAYAIGEIFLVVVGILIALWINSKNQERINEAKAVNLLKEIQKDLKKDVKGVNEAINTFVTYDSIAKLLLWDKLTADEMFTDETKSYGIVYRPISFKSSENGYVNFKRNLNNIPTKYNSISNKLKDLYGLLRVGVETESEVLTSTVLENLDKVNSLDWNVASEKGFMPEEGKNYYMRELEFKKQLLRYMQCIENFFVTTESYKLKAIDMHNKISKILNTNDYITYQFKSSRNSLHEKNILGKYILKETVEPLFAKTIELRKVDNKLQFLVEGYGIFEFYKYDKNTFLGMMQHNKMISNIRFNKSKNIEFHISAGKRAYAYYTKVSD